jgi:uncharacterized protein YndB with AHSA1/START domain
MARSIASLAGRLSLAFLLTAGAAHAELEDASAGGFVSAHQAVVAAGSERVWQALTGEVSRWWHPDHTYGGDSGKLSIDARAQGCFCEQIPGGSVSHLTVVFADKGRRLRMIGGLGPLQGEAVSGVMNWELKEADGLTEVKMTYAVGGYRPGGLEAWAPPVDQVNGIQFQRLIRYIETGDPEQS